LHLVCRCKVLKLRSRAMADCPLLGRAILVTMQRRAWFAVAAGWAVSWRTLYGFAGKEFWDAKEPADWSSDEIKKLLTKSPWAHETSGERTSTSKKNASDFPQTGVDSRGRPRTPRPASGPSTRVVASLKGTVVWESAKPVRLAVKDALADEFAGMYVLSLSGVPVGSGKGAPEKVRAATSLHLKGHDPLEAAVVKHAEAGRGAVIFGFAREGLEISKEDKEVVFATLINRIPLSAKFNPRDMVYRGELAL
jgi:hypothetical protein